MEKSLLKSEKKYFPNISPHFWMLQVAKYLIWVNISKCGKNVSVTDGLPAKQNEKLNSSENKNC